MRSIWVTIFAFIIAVTSIVIDFRLDDFSHEEISSIDVVQAWQVDDLIHPGKKVSDNNLFIAEDFIPIVIIAEAQDSEQSFNHYLPVYQLQRQKEFFLLI
jgi:hypothetical protein